MFIIFENSQEAESFNSKEAENRGCSGSTTRWYASIVHPVNSWVALNVGDDFYENAVQELDGSWFIDYDV